MLVLLTDELPGAAVLERSVDIVGGGVARTSESFFRSGKACSNKTKFYDDGINPCQLLCDLCAIILKWKPNV